MAGSFSHIVGKDGRFTDGLLDHMGDGGEALEECYRIIYYLSGGSTDLVSAACKHLGLVDPWREQNEPRAQMRVDSK